MKIIKETPNKNYKLYLVDGKYIHTGYVSCWTLHGKDIKEIDVCVVELDLELIGVGRGRSSVTFSFKEVGTENVYETGPRASLELFRKTSYGRIKGLFTFKKQGDSVYLFPYEEE